MIFLEFLSSIGFIFTFFNWTRINTDFQDIYLGLVQFSWRRGLKDSRGHKLHLKIARIFNPYRLGKNICLAVYLIK
jgi:hypothetical protein